MHNFFYLMNSSALSGHPNVPIEDLWDSQRSSEPNHLPVDWTLQIGSTPDVHEYAHPTVSSFNHPYRIQIMLTLQSEKRSYRIAS